MRNLFRRKELRQTSETDVIVQTIINSAANNRAAVPGATSAVEIASGIVQRALMSATINDTLQGIGLTASVMGAIGRALARRGQVVFRIENRNGIQLQAANSFDVRGSYDQTTWRYDLHLQGPSRAKTVKSVKSEDVLHFRWSYDVSKPWQGIGPIQSANLDARLLAAIVKALGDEALTPRGYFIPVPKTGGQDASVELLKGDIKQADGSSLLVESMSDSWQTGGQGQANHDWQVRRFGANPPEGLLKLYKQAHNAVLEAYGLSSALLADSTGTGSRESWRIALFGLINPLAKMIENELLAKLGIQAQLNFDELRASDLQGRARGFKSLVDGGVPVDQALQMAGF